MTIGGIITMCISIGAVWALFIACILRLVKSENAAESENSPSDE